MYERHFDTLGAGPTSEELLERAYALGVASVCGDPADETYERLKRNSPDAYDETILELAYEEGRASAFDLEADEADAEAIWERLVERELDRKRSESARSTLPEAIFLPEADGPPEHLDLPSFLRR